ncbi:universal stress protein [Plantactinospora sp. WMMB334]|uniref:universal stress protein n=1 Tax=Plantactinospora sp. WMMB334 TaxID=3404119 RepID=UPI003B929C4F
MSDSPGGQVVVGIDGSESALAAARLAAREAALHGRPLLLVHAFVWALLPVPLGPDPAGPPEGGFRHQAERVVAEAMREARRAAPGVTVSATIDDGSAAPVLLRHARHAAMLVLGDRGLDGFSGLLLGSIAVQAATHATCPVVVVRGQERPGGPVVVGVDGSEVSERAVAFAFDEAARRGVPLVAAHAWRYPTSTAPGDMLPLVYDRDVPGTDEEVVLAQSIAGWRERYPEVSVIRRLRHGRPGSVLIEESAEAGLLVVGSRGRGGFTGLLLGSVSHAALHHAACPVAVVHR